MGPACSCGMHVSYSRSQIGMLNDPHRRDIYYSLLKEVKLDDIDKTLITKYNVVMWLLEVFDHSIICKSCRYCFSVIYM